MVHRAKKASSVDRITTPQRRRSLRLQTQSEARLSLLTPPFARFAPASAKSTPAPPKSTPPASAKNTPPPSAKSTPLGSLTERLQNVITILECDSSKALNSSPFVGRGGSNSVVAEGGTPSVSHQTGEKTVGGGDESNNRGDVQGGKRGQHTVGKEGPRAAAGKQKGAAASPASVEVEGNGENGCGKKGSIEIHCMGAEIESTSKGVQARRAIQMRDVGVQVQIEIEPSKPSQSCEMEIDGLNKATSNDGKSKAASELRSSSKRQNESMGDEGSSKKQKKQSDDSVEEVEDSEAEEIEREKEKKRKNDSSVPCSPSGISLDPSKEASAKANWNQKMGSNAGNGKEKRSPDKTAMETILLSDLHISPVGDSIPGGSGSMNIGNVQFGALAVSDDDDGGPSLKSDSLSQPIYIQELDPSLHKYMQEAGDSLFDSEQEDLSKEENKNSAQNALKKQLSPVEEDPVSVATTNFSAKKGLEEVPIPNAQFPEVKIEDGQEEERVLAETISDPVSPPETSLEPAGEANENQEVPEKASDPVSPPEASLEPVAEVNQSQMVAERASDPVSPPEKFLEPATELNENEKVGEKASDPVSPPEIFLEPAAEVNENEKVAEKASDPVSPPEASLEPATEVNRNQVVAEEASDPISPPEGSLEPAMEANRNQEVAEEPSDPSSPPGFISLDLAAEVSENEEEVETSSDPCSSEPFSPPGFNSLKPATEANQNQKVVEGETDESPGRTPDEKILLSNLEISADEEGVPDSGGSDIIHTAAAAVDEDKMVDDETSEEGSLQHSSETEATPEEEDGEESDGVEEEPVSLPQRSRKRKAAGLDGAGYKKRSIFLYYNVKFDPTEICRTIF